MKRKSIITLMGIMAIAAVATIVYAQPQGPGMMQGKMQGRMQGKVLEALGLSAEQKDKLHMMRSAHQKEMAQLRANAQIAQIELRDLLRQDDPKDADVKTKIAAANSARGKMMEAQITFGLKMKQVLTPEQRQKWQEMKAHRPMRNRGEGRMNRGDDPMFRQHRQNPRGPFMPGAFDGETEEGELETNM